MILVPAYLVICADYDSPTHAHWKINKIKFLHMFKFVCGLSKFSCGPSVDNDYFKQSEKILISNRSLC